MYTCIHDDHRLLAAVCEEFSPNPSFDPNLTFDYGSRAAVLWLDR